MQLDQFADLAHFIGGLESVEVYVETLSKAHTLVRGISPFF